MKINLVVALAILVIVFSGCDKNNKPTANTGVDLAPNIGELIQLDGSGSVDPDGDELTYLWTIEGAPEGSIATLSNPSIVNPTFSADISGNYTLVLIVNDGEEYSTSDVLNIIVTSNKPMANAGIDQTVIIGELIQLDGSGSIDPDGDELSYLWTIKGTPEGSIATFSNPSLANPTFFPDVSGNYTFSLVVNDGEDYSTSDELSIIVFKEDFINIAHYDSTKMLRKVINYTFNNRAYTDYFSPEVRKGDTLILDVNNDGITDIVVRYINYSVPANAIVTELGLEFYNSAAIIEKTKSYEFYHSGVADIDTSVYQDPIYLIELFDKNSKIFKKESLWSTNSSAGIYHYSLNYFVGCRGWYYGEDYATEKYIPFMTSKNDDTYLGWIKISYKFIRGYERDCVLHEYCIQK